MGKLYVVGIGPGDVKYMTIKAFEILRNVDVVVGYDKYVNFIKDIIEGKEVYTTGMGKEVDRCLIALKEAKNCRNVALICGGDPGVYGLAGLVLELNFRKGFNVEIEIVPGITAALAAAALLGAPLMRDFVVLNLSDLLIPWSEIEYKLIKRREHLHERNLEAHGKRLPWSFRIERWLSYVWFWG